MTIAIDSSVLICIFNDEPGRAAWFKFLLDSRMESRFVACDVVWAELGPLFATSALLHETMAKLGVLFSPLNEAASFEAGQLFAAYRRRGGPRTRIIADFMIAAHALHHANALATADLAFAEKYVSRLKLVGP